MISFFTNEEAKFESSSPEERSAQLKKAFFSNAASAMVLAIIGSIIWNPDWFFYAGILAAIIISFEPLTQHYFPFRMTRAIGVFTGSGIGSCTIGLFHFYGVL